MGEGNINGANGSRFGVRISPTIEAGHLLQAAIITVGALVWLITGSDRAQQVQTDFAMFRAELRTQLTEQHKDMQSLLLEMPAIQTQIRNIDTRFSDMISQQSRMAQDLGRMTERVAGLRSDVDNLKNASGIRDGSTPTRPH